MSRILLAALVLAGTSAFATSQSDGDKVLATFTAKIDTYVERHRRIEGPVPPLSAGRDLADVRHLMSELRRGIRKEGVSEQGQYFTRDVRLALRRRVATALTPAEIQDLIEDLIEHTPPFLPPIRVYQPLPDDAPFVQIPPRLFKVLPTLPPELRYVILDKGLVLWDHHADLVIDAAPGLLDPRAFRTKSDN